MRCASLPVRGEATRPGRRVSRSSSSARPISARFRAKTSRASATGGLTNARSDLLHFLFGYRKKPVQPSTFLLSIDEDPAHGVAGVRILEAFAGSEVLRGVRGH